MHPETGFNELRTAEIVARVLRSLGFSVREKVALTGVVGILEGGCPGRTVALRADMDALPIQDVKEVPYRSTVRGVAHACGHDAHVAMLLGAAVILSRFRSELPGRFVLIFQPAEEGPGGALPMLEEGVLDHHRAEGIVALHVYNHLPAGHVGVRYGLSNAAVDNVQLEIMGSGGHGAAPHQGVDAVLLAARVVCALQTIVSRRVDPLDPVVLSIGTINGGYRENVLADRVSMTGTIRTLNEATRELLPGWIDDLVRGVAVSGGGDCRLEIKRSYPALRNDPALTSLVESTALEYFDSQGLPGSDMVRVLEHPSMGAEDFAYFADRVPGCFFRLGTSPLDRPAHPGHHPAFDIDESALPVGSALLTAIACRFNGGSEGDVKGDAMNEDANTHGHSRRRAREQYGNDGEKKVVRGGD
ncbi:MAG: amidohydrolase [Firmicutes bacterium]|nr:amidohydrolase [Bacillota bacterium]